MSVNSDKLNTLFWRPTEADGSCKHQVTDPERMREVMGKNSVDPPSVKDLDVTSLHQYHVTGSLKESLNMNNL